MAVNLKEAMARIRLGELEKSIAILAQLAPADKTRKSVMFGRVTKRLALAFSSSTDPESQLVACNHFKTAIQVFQDRNYRRTLEKLFVEMRALVLSSELQDGVQPFTGHSKLPYHVAVHLHNSVQVGNSETVAELLDHEQLNVNLLMTDSYDYGVCTVDTGMTPLHVAALSGRVENCQMLLKYGAILNSETIAFKNAYAVSLLSNAAKVTEFLLQQHVDMMQTTKVTDPHACFTPPHPRLRF